jgi:hypothetical protein
MKFDNVEEFKTKYGAKIYYDKFYNKNYPLQYEDEYKGIVIRASAKSYRKSKLHVYVQQSKQEIDSSSQ